MTSEIASGPGITVGGRQVAIAPHNCFACGELNRDGLHLAIHTDADGAWSEIALAPRFEGWEGIAHGGVVCTLLDEVMAWSLVEQGAWGVTARLAVDFRKPVPIGTRIRAEGRVVRARRRVFDTAARLFDPATDTEFATAEAVYVVVPDDRAATLRARYAFRVVDEGEDASAEPRRGESNRPDGGTGLDELPDTVDTADVADVAEGPRGGGAA